MTQFAIGGASISVSLGNYKRLKRAWKYIDAARSGGFTTSTDAIVGVIAVGMDSSLDGEPASEQAAIEAFRIDWIDEHLTGQDIKKLKDSMNDLMVDSGLADPPGEDQPAKGEASLSTETLTPSLPN